MQMASCYCTFDMKLLHSPAVNILVNTSLLTLCRWEMRHIRVAGWYFMIIDDIWLNLLINKHHWHGMAAWSLKHDLYKIWLGRSCITWQPYRCSLYAAILVILDGTLDFFHPWSGTWCWCNVGGLRLWSRKLCASDASVRKSNINLSRRSPAIYSLDNIPIQQYTKDVCVHTYVHADTYMYTHLHVWTHTSLVYCWMGMLSNE